MLKPVIIATLTAGTLDIISAFVFAGMAGTSPTGVLQFVASGPFGASVQPIALWALIGLLVHFAIMAVIATIYIAAAQARPRLLQKPIRAGLLYGFGVWLVMYWIVRPLRWPAMWPPSAYATRTAGQIVWSIGNQLFSHCILVGLPIALIAARFYDRRSKAR